MPHFPLEDNHPLKKEFESHDKVFEGICKAIKKHPGYTVDWQLIYKAWAKSKELHFDARRYSKELYICHPRSVMEDLSHLRCKSSLLAAALLHDTIEGCSMTFEELREDFSYEVAQIVAGATAIKAEEKAAEANLDSMSDEERLAFVDRLTDPKLLDSQYLREAFLVRFADRAHNLATVEYCPTALRLSKVASTRAFLIPAAQKLGIRYYETTLNDLCMKYEGDNYHENASAKLLKKRHELTRVSGSAYSRFDQLLQSALEEQTIFSLPKFNPFAQLRGLNREGSDEILVRPRRVMTCYELQQQLKLVKQFDRSKLDLWEIILVCSDRNSHEMLKHFFTLYRDHMKKDVYFEYVGQEKDAIIVRLSDKLQNNYRVVLISESKLESHFIGDSMLAVEAPADGLRPQITVYAYSEKKKRFRKYDKCVPFGATALDFAFIVNPALALAAKSARIQKWTEGSKNPFSAQDHTYPLHTVLSDGDVVNFDAEYPPSEADTEAADAAKQAKLDWFAYINTELAKNCLIQYFKEKYEPEDTCDNK